MSITPFMCAFLCTCVGILLRVYSLATCVLPFTRWPTASWSEAATEMETGVLRLSLYHTILLHTGWGTHCTLYVHVVEQEIVVGVTSLLYCTVNILGCWNLSTFCRIYSHWTLCIEIATNFVVSKSRRVHYRWLLSVLGSLGCCACY